MFLKTTHTTPSIFTKYGIYLILSIAFVPALINVVTYAYGPVENYGWNILYYHVGYETGFGGRKLLASVCHLFFPDFVQLRHIRTMVIAVNFIMVALFAIFVSKCYNKSKRPLSTLPVIVLYAVGPFSIIAFMSSGLSVAFTETYQITLTLLWLLLWTKYRGRWPFFIATLLAAGICCLQHHTFCCTLFPLYVGLFTYDTIDRKNIQIKNAIGYGLVCLVLLGILVIIWKYSRMTVDVDQLNEWFQGHVAVNAYECSREAQNAYYYLTNAENRASVSILLTWKYRYGELPWTIVLLSPLLATIYYPWIRASRTAPTNLSSWRYRMVWIAVTLLTLPIFFMATDYNRWFVCYFFSMLSVTIATLAIGDRLLTSATIRMLRWFLKHPIVTMALVIYLNGLHCTPFSLKFGLQEGIDTWAFLKALMY